MKKLKFRIKIWRVQRAIKQEKLLTAAALLNINYLDLTLDEFAQALENAMANLFIAYAIEARK